MVSTGKSSPCILLSAKPPAIEIVQVLNRVEDPAGRQQYSIFNLYEFVKSQKPSVFVIPANAGIQDNEVSMDPRSPIGVEDKLRGGDGLGDFLRDHQFSLSHRIFRNRRSRHPLLIQGSLHDFQEGFKNGCRLLFLKI